MCPLVGPNNGTLGYMKGQPQVAVFMFGRQFPALNTCTITVESADDKPIKVLSMVHLTITDARMIVLNAKQPNHCVVGGGGTTMC